MLEKAVCRGVQRLLIDIAVPVIRISCFVQDGRQDGQGARCRAADMDRGYIGEIDISPPRSPRRVDRHCRLAGTADLDIERNRLSPEFRYLFSDFGNLRTVMVCEKRNFHRHKCPTPKIELENRMIRS